MSRIFLALLLSIASVTAHAGSSCSVANNNGSCSIACPDGHAAICRALPGVGPPQCYCKAPSVGSGDAVPLEPTQE